MKTSLSSIIKTSLGALVGLSIPVLFITLDLYEFGLEFNFNNVIRIIKSQKLHVVGLISSPIFFSIINYLFLLNRKKVNELILSEQYRSSIIDAINDLLFVVNEDGKIMSFNQKTIEILGFQQKQLLQINIFKMITFPKETQTKNKFLNLLKEDKLHAQEVTCKTNSGDTISLLLSARSLNSPLTSEKNIVISATDLTEQKELQSQVLHSAKLASIGELAAGVGHEINNPLMILLGNMETQISSLRKNNFNKDVYINFLEKQMRSIDRIKNIVNGLRRFARSNSQKIKAFSCHQLIHENVQLIQKIYENSGIEITLKLHAFDDTVMGNKGKFQQAIMNFLSNARDATEEQEIRTIVIKSENNYDGDVCLSFTDNGCGIPPDIQEKIFQSFFTTKVEGKGTGMGLSITSQIISEMNGRIHLNSEPNYGSTFTLILPTSSEEIFDDENTPLPDFVETSEQLILTGTALVVEDEKDIRDIIKIFLEDLGLSVTLVKDGKEGFEAIQNHKFQYIFTDMKMPIMGGEEFIHKSKSHINCSETFFFIMTGGISSGVTPERSRLLKKIVDGFIYKPFTREILICTLQKAFTKIKDTHKKAS